MYRTIHLCLLPPLFWLELGQLQKEASTTAGATFQQQGPQTPSSSLTRGSGHSIFLLVSVYQHQACAAGISAVKCVYTALCIAFTCSNHVCLLCLGSVDSRLADPVPSLKPFRIHSSWTGVELLYSAGRPVSELQIASTGLCICRLHVVLL